MGTLTTELSEAHGEQGQILGTFRILPNGNYQLTWYILPFFLKYILYHTVSSNQYVIYTGHLIGAEKNGKLCGNFRQYYAEESDDYAEKTPDYAEISNINKVVPMAFSNV